MRFILVVSSWVLCASAGVASECRAAIGEFLAAAADVRTSDKHTIAGEIDVADLEHKDVPRLHLTCFDGRVTLHADWPEGVPDSRYWAALARLGRALTAESEKAVRAGAVTCRDRALNDRSELAEVETGKLHFECQAFTRQGGATAISVRRR